MADSFVRLPADGAGKLLDTRTAPDGDHREVVVVGSPTLADVAEADVTNGLDVDVTRVQGSVAVTNAALTSLAGAIAGTEVQVDIVSGGSAGVQYTEDDAAPANPVGTALAMVRDDVLSGLTTADGDIVAARATDKGELYVKHVDAIPVTDNSGSLTVDGTVTANAGTNLNTSALALEAGGNLAAAATSLATLDNIVSGSEAQVDIVAALPAGTNNIGDVDIASLPNEGQQSMANSISVAIASDQSTVPVSLAAGGTTQYAEDTAHVSGDLVTLAGVVQQSADAALSSDGDRSILQVDASGFLKVNIKAGAGSGGTAMADDAAFTPAVTQGTPTFAFADETAPDSVDEGDAGALRMTLDRKLLTRVVGATDANRLDVDASGHAQVDIAAASVAVPVTDNAGSLTVDNAALSVVGGGVEATALRVTLASDSTGLVSVDDNGGSLTVDGTVAVSGAVDTELPAAAALADNTANPTAPAVGAFGQVWDGATWDRTPGDSVDGALVNLGANNDVGLNAGTNNIGDVDVLTLPALVAGSANIGDVDVLTMPVTEVVGDVAADAAVPANPLAVGGRASTAVPTAVSADGDSVYSWLNRLGMQVVSAIPGLGLNADPHTLLSETAQYTTTQTSAVLVTGGASERIVVTSIQIQVGGTTAGTLQVYFGTGAYARGTDEAIFDGEFAPSATLKPGFVSSPPSGYRAGALGDDILVTTSAAINPLTITVWYYILGV